MLALAVSLQVFFDLGEEFRLKRFLINAAFNFALILPIWLGNGYIAEGLSKYVSWLKEPGKRFVLSVLAMLVYSTLVFLVIDILYYVVVKGNDFNIVATPGFRNMLLFQIGITSLITFIMYSLSFFHSWRDLAVNQEKLKREHLRAEYESLRAQVNPHFLFNSLNALTSLVETDQKLAVKFIRKLSEVYRYLLDSSQKEVVPLQQEIDFIQSYFYLQQIRHGDAILLQNDLSPDGNIVVPPLALQLLLENAIKHNMSLEESPLSIHLYLEDDYLVVQNNLQERRTRETSTATGLQNIKSRYSFLTNKKVQIQQTDQHFIVKLPILHIKENAHTYS